MVDPQALQQQLDPLIEPLPLSFWPPAPGWFVIAILALGAIIWGLAKWHSRRQQRHYRRDALRQLQWIWSAYETNHNACDFINQTNQLLKRVAITAYPAQDCAQLSGKEWLNFLQQHQPKSTIESSMNLLGSQRYQPNFNPAIDPTPLYHFAKQWINAHDA